MVVAKVQDDALERPRGVEHEPIPDGLGRALGLDAGPPRGVEVGVEPPDRGQHEAQAMQSCVSALGGQLERRASDRSGP